jgi:TonB-linked SusC/RagA family outer membrane protein
MSSITDVLVAKAAGVQVLPGNTTGAGARVRIRGASSFTLSNEPIYVIDGVRMESGVNSASRSTGGTIPSRVGDLNPDEIESVEIVKGPSASTLYGTDAANGVIVIKTKRGLAGRPRWTAYVEQGAVADRNEWPLNWTSYGTLANGTRTAGCFNFLVAASSCQRDSVLTYTPARDPETRPFTTGYRQQYGLQVGGGSEAVRYFVSGEWEDELGISKMPDVDVRSFQSRNIAVSDRWKRPNSYTRASARANLQFSLDSRTDVAVNAGYLKSRLELPQMDNNITGWTAGVLGGPGRKYPANPTAADTLYGFYAFRVGDQLQDEWNQDIDRFMGSMNVSWRPATWFATRGNFGIDLVDRVEEDLCRFETCAPFSTYREGFKIENRTNLYQYTADVSATAQFNVRPTLNSKTTAGMQFFRNLFDRNGANSAQLPPGATQVTAGAVPNGAPTTTFGEVTDDARTLGMFVEQTVGWRDRLFVTGAVRVDDNSAFGKDFEAAVYPKLSGSWVVSDESFFPRGTAVSQFRLRGAFGASGRQPNPQDALQYYDVQAVRLGGAELPGLVFRSLGNTDLKPERSTELELGFDAALLADRVNVQATYYAKSSKDALIQRVLPPSSGAGTTDANAFRLENLGEVRNAGVEAMVSAQLVQRRAFGWDMTLAASTNSNRLVDLGGVPPIIGATVRQVEGYPINGYWQRPITSFEDRDGNGLLSVDEVQVSSDFAFMGYSQPRTELSLTNGVELFDRLVRVQALLDYKGGHKLYNNTERIRCQSFGNCRGLNDPTASLEEQAAAVAAFALSSPTLAGYIEDAAFVRLREVAVTIAAPQRFATRLGARSLDLSIAARNVAMWSKYRGLDPESNYGQNDVPADFLGVAPPSYLTFRLNVGF